MTEKIDKSVFNHKGKERCEKISSPVNEIPILTNIFPRTNAIRVLLYVFINSAARRLFGEGSFSHAKILALLREKSAVSDPENRAEHSKSTKKSKVRKSSIIPDLPGVIFFRKNYF
jgi:hypothetical protein